ncbi:Transitional endoplasmic reticulum ATPase [Giardia lamblia P15]|uniref:Transitional endoplasmic reticulum ATPase n=1 Tax=Giardia intestinalis (strain P15) TaxID=658858 RepID=E1F3B1_GIAIA|nr:Transitional endoplasmic reticulum ATPase [Giardia lamblia P15]
MEPGRRHPGTLKSTALTTEEVKPFPRCFATCRTIIEINSYLEFIKELKRLEGKRERTDPPLVAQPPTYIKTEKKLEPVDIRPENIKNAQANSGGKSKIDIAQEGVGSHPILKSQKQSADKTPEKKISHNSKQTRTVESFCIAPHNILFEQLGGVKDIEKELTERVLWPILQADQYRYLGVTFGTGILLHAPTGSGKTAIVHALINKIHKELGRQISFYCINSTEIIMSRTGETEELLREIFLEAKENAPSVIFLDNVEIISTRGENVSREMERRIVAQLCSCMDEVASHVRPVLESLSKSKSDVTNNAHGQINQSTPVNSSTIVLNARPQPQQSSGSGGRTENRQGTSKEKPEPIGTESANANQYRAVSQLDKNEIVIVIGATSKINAIDESLRRAGRFDKDIPIPIPSKKQRIDILQKLLMGCKIDPNLNIQRIAENTPGYVGADLAALCREAGHRCVCRIMRSSNILDGMTKSMITLNDFLLAAQTLIPTALREGFATVPDVSLDDIGALDFLKAELDRYLLQPLKNPERFERLGLNRFSGIIMFSVPGQGKTLICKALSAKAEINFISVKGPELLNMYYGESERAIRNVFARARASAPCILFLDEFDSLAKRRGSGGSSSDVSDKVVNTLLTELDGLHNNLSGEHSLNAKNAQDQIFIIAATNRIDIIDPGLLRPGRFDKIIYIPLPNLEDRVNILYTIITRRRISLDKTLQNPHDLREFLTEYLAKQTKGYTGADLEGLVRRAAMAVIAESQIGTEICKRHFMTALSQTKASVNEEDRIKYDMMAAHYSKLCISESK